MVNYEQILSARVKEVQPSGIRRFFELAAKMPHAISLGVGEPDFETPWQIRRAGIQSLEKGQTFYTSNWGLAELRNQIAALVRRKYRLCYDADKEILVTVGGSEAIDNTIRAIVNVGDEVLIPEPSFVCYKPLTQMAGGVPVPLPTRAEDQFKLTADSLRAAITPRTKLLILPYPNNPTGAIMTRDELQAIATVIKDTNIIVNVFSLDSHATTMAVKPRPSAMPVEMVCPAPPTSTKPATPQIAPEMAMVRMMTRLTLMPA